MTAQVILLSQAEHTAIAISYTFKQTAIAKLAICGKSTTPGRLFGISNVR